MKTFSVSTFSIHNAPRLAVQRLQDELRDAQKEVASGRLADVGADLGAATGRLVSLRSDQAGLERMIETDGLIGQRFAAMQTVLESIAKSANSLQATLVGTGTDSASIAAAESEAAAGLEQLVSALATAFGDSFMFSGEAIDRQPLADYAESDASALVEEAAANAGPPPIGNATTGAELAAFLDGPFAEIFALDDPAAGWRANWSSSGDESVENRITPSETVTVFVSANRPAFRDLAEAYVMLSQLGAGEMNENARDALKQKAVAKLGSGLSDLTRLRADIGAREARVESAIESLEARSTTLSFAINDMEGVDQYEAATRVTALLTQLESSYALTARLQGLSLVNYLR